jgi:hypothetical protein
VRALEDVKMSPYRQAPQQHSTKPRDRSDQGRGVGIAVMMVSAFMVLVCFDMAPPPLVLSFALGLVVLGFVAGAWIALHGKSQDAHARLARLTWHRGRRLRATLLAIGLVSPRCSRKRLERYRATNVAKVIEAGVPDTFGNPLGQKLVTMIVEQILEALKP